MNRLTDQDMAQIEIIVVRAVQKAIDSHESKCSVLDHHRTLHGNGSDGLVLRTDRLEQVQEYEKAKRRDLKRPIVVAVLAAILTAALTITGGIILNGIW